jgi:hypothetical protein
LKKVAESDKEAVVTIKPTLRSREGEVFMVEVTVCHRNGTITGWGGTTRWRTLHYCRISTMEDTPLLPDLHQRFKTERGRGTLGL